MKTNLPYYTKVRNIIEQVENYNLRMFFKAQYLLGARASELTGKIYPSDKHEHKEPIGPKSSDVAEGFFEKYNIPIFLFTIRIERGKWDDPNERIIALPKDGDFWAYELYNHFKETKYNEFVFPFPRQVVFSTIRETGIFNDLKYNVNASSKQKPFTNDKLRKVRLFELRDKYHFTRDEEEAYGITKLHETSIGIETKSLINKWNIYIGKLYDIDMKSENKKQPQKVENAGESYRPEWGWTNGTLTLHNIKFGHVLCEAVPISEISPLRYNQIPIPKRMCKRCVISLNEIEKCPKKLTNEIKKLQEPTNKVKKKLTLSDFSEHFPEKESKVLINEMKIFHSADEKIEQAKFCFQNEDYPSVLHSLNTSLELVLKNKLGIPATKLNINTSNIIDILAKYKIEPYIYLIEARKYVLNIDNKIKHTGYSPSKIDCINGMKAMEELIDKLRNINLELSEEIRNKIFEGL